MPSDSSDDTTALAPSDPSDPDERSRRRSPRRDWRLGGRTVLRWREDLLAITLFSLGATVLLGALLRAAAPNTAVAFASLALLWIGMLIPIVWAFRRSRPAGLLRFRAIDLLWGFGLAVLLRLAQGSLATAFGGSGALPRLPQDRGTDAWWPAEFAGGVFVTPVLEELLFRGVLLVAVFTILRRTLGKLPAGVIAVVVSAIASVVVQAADTGFDAAEVAATALLGLVCGALVALTGRIWGAVLVHVFYAASLALLAVAGSLLS